MNQEQRGTDRDEQMVAEALEIARCTDPASYDTAKLAALPTKDRNDLLAASWSMWSAMQSLRVMMDLRMLWDYVAEQRRIERLALVAEHQGPGFFDAICAMNRREAGAVLAARDEMAHLMLKLSVQVKSGADLKAQQRGGK